MTLADFRFWHKAAVQAVRGLFGSRRQTGRAGEVVGTAAYDPKRNSGLGLLKPNFPPAF
jgi:hypothetical protein